MARHAQAYWQLDLSVIKKSSRLRAWREMRPSGLVRFLTGAARIRNGHGDAKTRASTNKAAYAATLSLG